IPAHSSLGKRRLAARRFHWANLVWRETATAYWSLAEKLRLPICNSSRSLFVHGLHAGLVALTRRFGQLIVEEKRDSEGIVNEGERNIGYQQSMPTTFFNGSHIKLDPAIVHVVSNWATDCIADCAAPSDEKYAEGQCSRS